MKYQILSLPLHSVTALVNSLASLSSFYFTLDILPTHSFIALFFLLLTHLHTLFFPLKHKLFPSYISHQSSNRPILCHLTRGWWLNWFKSAPETSSNAPVTTELNRLLAVELNFTLQLNRKGFYDWFLLSPSVEWSTLVIQATARYKWIICGCWSSWENLGSGHIFCQWKICLFSLCNYAKHIFTNWIKRCNFSIH